MSTTNKPDQPVPENVRDQIFKQLKGLNKNNICVDCDKKNTKWASIHLGIQLCIDCAGKHRQYGVMYSFVKSTNLDVWNRKQLMFMQKGGNARALEYFRKCGVISDTQKHIDYKSPIVQKYKSILTAEVESELNGTPIKQVKQVSDKKKVEVAGDDDQIKKPTEIPNAEVVVKQEKGKKKNKKKGGKKINLEDFDTMEFDDGVPIEQKQKIIRAYESNAKAHEEIKIPNSNGNNQGAQTEKYQTFEVPEKARELNEEEAKQKLEQIKGKSNLNAISSQDFKDNSLDDFTVRQNLNKFQSSSSISSSAFFGDKEQEEQQGSLSKVKDYVADTGSSLYNKLSGLGSYWKK